MGRFYVKFKKAGRKKSNNKNSKPISRRRLLITSSSLIIAAIILASFYTLYIKSRHFLVKDIVIIGSDQESSVDYADLRRMIEGENIFQVNLKDIRSNMLDNYGELLDLRLERAFPDSIIATVFLREPVAQLYRGRYYPIDGDGVILSGDKDEPYEKLPVINGARFNPSKEIGKVTNSKRANKALKLLNGLSTSGILDGHTLIEIDASRLRNIIFFLEDGLEVKIGHEDYASRLENLKKILSDPKLKPADIRYIDLRFKEPVIGPKWKN